VHQAAAPAERVAVLRKARHRAVPAHGGLRRARRRAAARAGRSPRLRVEREPGAPPHAHPLRADTLRALFVQSVHAGAVHRLASTSVAVLAAGLYKQIAHVHALCAVGAPTHSRQLVTHQAQAVSARRCDAVP
jgi:hypothetical protein